MITVHHLEDSRSQRVLWLLEELAIPYEVERYARNPETMLAPPELRMIHPLGKSPVIDDHGVVYAETGAIVQHIVEAHGGDRLRPADPEGLRRYTYWLHYAEGSAMTPLLLKLMFSVMPARAPWLVRPLVKAIAGQAQSGFVDPQLALHMDFWEAELATHAWFAGDDFSAADVMMSFPLEAAASRAGLSAGRPHCMEFLIKVQSRPAYMRALERGGPYAYAE